jgi:hypothetical protein
MTGAMPGHTTAMPGQTTVMPDLIGHLKRI